MATFMYCIIRHLSSAIVCVYETDVSIYIYTHSQRCDIAVQLFYSSGKTVPLNFCHLESLVSSERLAKKSQGGQDTEIRQRFYLLFKILFN